MSGKEEQKPSLCKSQECTLPVMGSSKSENETADELCTQETLFYPDKEERNILQKTWLLTVDSLAVVICGIFPLCSWAKLSSK